MPMDTHRRTTHHAAPLRPLIKGGNPLIILTTEHGVAATVAKIEID